MKQHIALRGVPAAISLRACVKILFLLVYPIGFGILAGILFSSRISSLAPTETQDSDILAVFPMKYKTWKDLGTVEEPLISLRVKTQEGYKANDFILDSGAVVSSLAPEWAALLGYQLEYLPRSSFRGFGNEISTAYQGEMTLFFGQKELVIPVVFTQAGATRSLLGRKGIFSNYTIVFDHKKKQIEIRI